MYSDRTDISEEIDVNKSNKSKECMICHYWYFLDSGYYMSQNCNDCHNISIMTFRLENIAILNIKGVDCRCVVWNMSRNDAINRLNNSELDDEGSL